MGLGWMDGLKVALGSRVMTVEAARHTVIIIIKTSSTGPSWNPTITCVTED